MRKVKARACSNLALLKYWGRKDNALRLPANNSISLNLDKLITTTTLEKADKDVLVIDGEVKQGGEFKRVVNFLDLAGGIGRVKCKVVSENSFPVATGFSASASGFAALAAAANEFFKLDLGEKELSILARKGSGSACRSIPSGFVRWKTGNRDEESYAETIFEADYWDLRILAVVVSKKVKEVPTSEGHELAWSSPYFKTRLKIIKQREKELLSVLRSKDFEKLGFIVEREMFEFQTIPMTSKPNLFYWYPQTVEVIHWVCSLRKEEDLPVFCTINTGHNVYLLTLPDKVEQVLGRLKKLAIVEQVIENRVGKGAEVIERCRGDEGGYR